MELFYKVDNVALKVNLFINALIESLFSSVKTETVRKYSGPLVVFVVVVFVLFITWALGDTLCWMRGRRSFSWAVKLGKS